MKLNEVIENFNKGEEIIFKKHDNIYKVIPKLISNKIIPVCKNICNENDYVSVQLIFKSQQMIESINGNKISIDDIDIKSFIVEKKFIKGK